MPQIIFLFLFSVCIHIFVSLFSVHTYICFSFQCAYIVLVFFSVCIHIFLLSNILYPCYTPVVRDRTFLSVVASTLSNNPMLKACNITHIHRTLNRC